MRSASLGSFMSAFSRLLLVGALVRVPIASPGMFVSSASLRHRGVRECVPRGVALLSLVSSRLIALASLEPFLDVTKNS